MIKNNSQKFENLKSSDDYQVRNKISEIKGSESEWQVRIEIPYKIRLPNNIMFDDFSLFAYFTSPIVWQIALFLSLFTSIIFFFTLLLKKNKSLSSSLKAFLVALPISFLAWDFIIGLLVWLIVIYL